MESLEVKTKAELPQRSRGDSPCWKKDPAGGFVANAKEHFDQFVSTSMDEHRICLKKTIKGLENYIKLKKQNKPHLKAGAAGKSQLAQGSPAVQGVASQ